MYRWNLGLSLQRNNIHWGCLGTQCWGECLVLNGNNYREHCMRRFIICTLQNIIIIIIIIIITTLKPFVGPWPLFTVSWSYTQSVGPFGWGISLSQGHYLHTEQHKQRIKAHNTDIHGFEPTIPAFERAEIVHALDRTATVFGTKHY
jgi:hypothetical protein